MKVKVENTPISSVTETVYHIKLPDDFPPMEDPPPTEKELEPTEKKTKWDDLTVIAAHVLKQTERFKQIKEEVK